MKMFRGRRIKQQKRRIHLKSDGYMLYIAFFDCGEKGLHFAGNSNSIIIITILMLHSIDIILHLCIMGLWQEEYR